MHDRIKLVIIEEEDLQLPDPEVYQRLFTELYGQLKSLRLDIGHLLPRLSGLSIQQIHCIQFL